MATPIHGLAPKKYVPPALLIGCLLALLPTVLVGHAQEPVEVVATEGGGRIEHHQVGGQELSIYVPKGYDTAALRYPVVYLIHGFSGTNRTFLGEGYSGPWPSGNAVTKVEKLVESGQIDPLILVFPHIRGIVPQHSISAEAYIVQEVVPFVDARYRTLPVPDWLSAENAVLVPWMTGFRMSFRTEVVRAVGFDEALKRYAVFEDVDASFRVLKTHVLVGARNAEIYHHKAPSRRGCMRIQAPVAPLKVTPPP